MNKPKIYTMRFAKIYPLYVQKAQKKNRTQEEMNYLMVKRVYRRRNSSAY